MLRRDGSGLPWGGKGEMLTQVERISKKTILAAGLRPELTFTSPNSDNLRAKSPIVSGKYLKYSRFRETATGDRVRSGLRGGPWSPRSLPRARPPAKLLASSPPNPRADEDRDVGEVV
jgi:hypothetical protein